MLWGKRLGTNELDRTAMYCSSELSLLLRATETDISKAALKQNLCAKAKGHSVKETV